MDGPAMSGICLTDAEAAALRVLLSTGKISAGPIGVVMSALQERLGDEIMPGDGHKVHRAAKKIQQQRRMEVYAPWIDYGGG